MVNKVNNVIWRQLEAKNQIKSYEKEAKCNRRSEQTSANAPLSLHRSNNWSHIYGLKVEIPIKVPAILAYWDIKEPHPPLQPWFSKSPIQPPLSTPRVRWLESPPWNAVAKNGMGYVGRPRLTSLRCNSILRTLSRTFRAVNESGVRSLSSEWSG